MNCCQNARIPAPTPSHVAPSSHVSWPRRIATFFQWALPLTTLALIPKCPMCVAAYVLLFTGLGVSISTASALRYTLIALSVIALAYLLMRTFRRSLSRPSVSPT